MQMYRFTSRPLLVTRAYDPFGRRVRSQFTSPSGPNTFFIYDGDLLLGEVQASGGWLGLLRSLRTFSRATIARIGRVNATCFVRFVRGAKADPPPPPPGNGGGT